VYWGLAALWAASIPFAGDNPGGLVALWIVIFFAVGLLMHFGVSRAALLLADATSQPNSQVVQSVRIVSDAPRRATPVAPYDSSEAPTCEYGDWPTPANL